MYRAKEYIDDIKLRLSRLDVKLELDNPSILTILNAARKTVQASTLALYPERYGKVVRIDFGNLVAVTDGEVVNPITSVNIEQYTAPLPDDFIEAHVVIMRYVLNGNLTGIGLGTYTNVTFNRECRRFDKRELFNIQQQSRNQPTILAPVYAIERNVVSFTAGVATAAVANYNLIISGVNFGTGSDTLIATATSGELEVWYTAMVPELEEFISTTPGALSDIELSIPVEFEELIIAHAMIGCLRKVRNSQKLIQDMMIDLKEMQDLVLDTYTTQRKKAGSLLPSKESVP